MTPSRKILIVSGEPSGDLHASNLVKDLKALRPDLAFFGLGGSLSAGAGVDIISDMSGLALVGVAEVVKNILAVGDVYKKLLARIDSERPDLAILVDYPGFNLRLAKELKRRSIPVAYYISPQVWAWGMERIETIKKCVEKIIVFFRFEEELYKKRGIDVEFVGHPLVDTVKVMSQKTDTLERYGLSKDKVTVALLPGSRRMEVGNLLPVMLSASKIIRWARGKTQFVVARHPDLPEEIFAEVIRSSRLDAVVATGDTYNVLAAADFAIVASGTATLETAMIGTPFVIVYKAHLLTYLAYLAVSRTPFLGLVNIIAGKAVVPELLQYNAVPRKIAEAALSIMSDEAAKETMRKDLTAVAALLGSPGASLRAASAILPLLA
jgi:lipid-A-disaccharide synthase